MHSPSGSFVNGKMHGSVDSLPAIPIGPSLVQPEGMGSPWSVDEGPEGGSAHRPRSRQAWVSDLDSDSAEANGLESDSQTISSLPRIVSSQPLHRDRFKDISVDLGNVGML